jgi:hypothetical protein
MTFRDRYFEALGLDPSDDQHKGRRAAALDRAHDIRIFEIELYWKRAAYFWAFQAIPFAAIALSVEHGTLHVGVPLLGAVVLGALTGTTGWLTAKGSKFWQENWEAHVELLEGPSGEGRLNAWEAGILDWTYHNWLARIARSRSLPKDQGAVRRIIARTPSRYASWVRGSQRRLSSL